MRFSPDGKIIATAGADCSIRLWSVETARMVIKLEGFRGWVRALAWTNDGSRLAAACNDGDVYVYHAFLHCIIVTFGQVRVPRQRVAVCHPCRPRRRGVHSRLVT